MVNFFVIFSDKYEKQSHFNLHLATYYRLWMRGCFMYSVCKYIYCNNLCSVWNINPLDFIYASSCI